MNPQGDGAGKLAAQPAAPFVALLRLSLPQLQELAAARVPAELGARAAEGALPPPFVAERALAQPRAGEPGAACATFAMQRVADGRIVGSCGFKHPPRDGMVEIGYHVAPENRGQGLGTQAVDALCQLAFADPAVDAVLACVAPANAASLRVVRKLGFSACGQRIDVDGEVVGDWLRQRPRAAADADAAAGARLSSPAPATATATATVPAATTRLQPMRESAYPAYLGAAVAGYAADNVNAGRWPAAGALERSRDEFATLLPLGLATPDHYLFELFGGDAAAPVGWLWVALERRGGSASTSAFVYDIEIEPSQRRRGHARRALQALEPWVNALGAQRLGLHVFADNEGAQALYRQLGFRVTGLNLDKPLAATAGAAAAETP
jgi:RimJ/RimL family protein N-acetyltransferase